MGADWCPAVGSLDSTNALSRRALLYPLSTCLYPVRPCGNHHKEVVSLGQETIYNFLEANPDRWYTAAEIMETLDKSPASVFSVLASLRKSGHIQFHKVPMGKKKKPTFRYKFKE